MPKKNAEEIKPNADETPPEEEAPPEEEIEDESDPDHGPNPLDALNKSIADSIATAEKEPGPFRKVMKFIHRLQGNDHFREFYHFIGERCMDFIRFAARNKDLFLEIIGLTALEIRDRKGKFELDDIDELFESSMLNTIDIINTDSNAIEFNVEWIEMAVRILIFILRNTGKLG